MKSEKIKIKKELPTISIGVFVFFMNALLMTFAIIFLGVYSNFLVITSNGGKMPVYGLDFETSTHFPITPENINEIKYLYLADIFPIGKHIWSLGDFLIYFGSALLVLLVIGSFIGIIIKIYLNEERKKCQQK